MPTELPDIELTIEDEDIIAPEPENGILMEPILDETDMSRETVSVISVTLERQLMQMVNNSSYGGTMSMDDIHHLTHRHISGDGVGPRAQLSQSGRAEITVGDGYGGVDYNGPSHYSNQSYEKPLKPSTTIPDANLEAIASRLGSIADEVDRRFGNVLEDAARQLVTEQFTWESFTRIASSVVSRGITWGRLIILLLFGFKLAYQLLVRHMPDALGDLVGHIVQFMMENNILQWLWRTYGGWNVVLRAPLAVASNRTVRTIVLMAAGSALLTLIINRLRHGG